MCPLASAAVCKLLSLSGNGAGVIGMFEGSLKEQKEA
jgi:hypothetical protein